MILNLQNGLQNLLEIVYKMVYNIVGGGFLWIIKKSFKQMNIIL